MNRQTHIYSDAHVATLVGWRRRWRHIAALETAFLTVVPSETDRIDGLIAAVPGADWAALDQREMFYTRETTVGIDHGLGGDVQVQHYHSPVALNEQSDVLRPILMSYLDVVVQGYLAEHGEAGVARFFETTDGWDAPVLDDRAQPRYPRHQDLSAAERALTDQWLHKFEVRVVYSDAD